MNRRQLRQQKQAKDASKKPTLKARARKLVNLEVEKDNTHKHVREGNITNFDSIAILQD